MAAQQEQAPEPTAADAADAPASHSGRLLVRMPATLHAELAQVARREGVSLNALVIGALSGAVGWRSPDAVGPPPAAETAPPGPVVAPAAGRTVAGTTTSAPVIVAPAAAPSRTLSVALAVNLVVVLLAAAAAIGLVIAAWPG